VVDGERQFSTEKTGNVVHVLVVLLNPLFHQQVPTAAGAAFITLDRKHSVRPSVIWLFNLPRRDQMHSLNSVIGRRPGAKLKVA
jgi:hypothetical protein